MSPTDIDLLARAGLVTVLFTVIIGGYRDWWRYGPAARKREDELAASAAKRELELMATCEKYLRDGQEWKVMALDLLRATSKLVAAEEKKR